MRLVSNKSKQIFEIKNFENFSRRFSFLRATAETKSLGVITKLDLTICKKSLNMLFSAHCEVENKYEILFADGSYLIDGYMNKRDV
jgi:hypothetical protein